MLLSNEPHLSLHVPEPDRRPGAAPSFDHLDLSAPGEVARPPIDADPADMRQMPFSLIRVLNDNGGAEGDWNPHLSPDELRSGLRKMMLTRAYDERMFRMQRQGKTSFYMKCTGEEAVAVAAAMALDKGDMCFPTYRQQGLLVARDWPLREMMNQVYSNSGDRLKGRQMPVFYSSREAGFFSISGNLGTQYIQAVGWAMGSAASKDSRIASAWIGDGATAEGDFHYALTFASVYRAPVVLNIVNNQWAISSFAGIAGAEQTTFAARGLAYGLPALRVDGNDFLAVYAATRWAADRARTNHGATVIELFTYRADAHSTSDDPTRYRPQAEGGAWPLGDPINRLRDHLIALGEWDGDRDAALAAEIAEHVRAEGKASEQLGTLGKGPQLDPASMFDDVYKTIPPHLARQRAELGF
jgi:2-oxoisovalerate dehydrogenase E1 component alpha subunit